MVTGPISRIPHHTCQLTTVVCWRANPGRPWHNTLHHRTSTVARGILDSYRREKGLPLTEAAQERSPAVTKELSVEPDELCPIDCVRTVHNLQEFNSVIYGVSKDTLVVCDFYKTACGACKYIQNGFVKLCKAADPDSPSSSVVFLKHNVIEGDDEEEQTDLASYLRIKSVPMFKFYKAGLEVESFATREKTRIAEAISRHTSL